MKLISLLFALFPEKIGSLPPELLSSLMKSIEFGMGGSFEISKFSLEALIALGSFAKSQRDKQGIRAISSRINDLSKCLFFFFKKKGATSTGFLNQHLDNFLGILLNLLLLQEFDSYLFDDASESLYWLVILRQGTYATLIHQLVQQQDTPSFKERLSEAVMEFNQSLHETVIANPSQESAHIHEYRNGLMRFLINARGFLRIK